MLNHIKEEFNMTRTENGAASYVSTYDYCLDMFSTIGALRNADETTIIDTFKRAYAENPDTAMKILFYARDVRGGLGERRAFRVILRWLADNRPESIIKNLDQIAEFGRYDDVMELLGTACDGEVFRLIQSQLKIDLDSMEGGKEVSLLAKWMPSINASSQETVAKAKRLCKALGMNQKEYRKMLTALRQHIRIIENHLREKDYTFDYSKQPSKAMFKYRKAFIRNDAPRYSEYLDAVQGGTATMHTSTLMPYDVIRSLAEWESLWGNMNGKNTSLSVEERNALNVAWENLPDFKMRGNSIAVIDGSGSMYGHGNPMPATVALSLGIYCAEHNEGLFRNHFITFSMNPQLVEIKGKDIADKVAYCESFNEVAYTNLERVFQLILEAAVKNQIPQDEVPDTIYVISDMEFNFAVRNHDKTIYQNAKELFEQAGYKLPQIVFWNVESRNRQQPVTKDENGTVLVSGCTPRLFEMVARGDYNPYSFMMEVIGSKRYENIAA